MMLESITGPIDNFIFGDDKLAKAYEDARDAIEWLRRDGATRETLSLYGSDVQLAYDRGDDEELRRLTAEIKALSSEAGGSPDRPSPFIVIQNETGWLDAVPKWAWVVGGGVLLAGAAALVIPWALDQAVKVKELRR